jgi:hypothetical protein
VGQEDSMLVSLGLAEELEGALALYRDLESYFR